MNQKLYIFCSLSNFGINSTIIDGVKVSDTLSLDGKLFRKFTHLSISDLFVRLVYLLNGTAWYFALSHSLIVKIDRSIIPTCSFLHICVVKQIVRTFLLFWCWTRCIHGSPLYCNLLYHILSLFPQVIWWMMLIILVSVVVLRGNWFLLS